MESNSKQGVQQLKIYQLAHELGVKVHAMSLNLPKFELLEEGSQIRRSSKSVSANIVEGFALRKYKNEFLRYLYRSFASSKETVEHIHYLYETQSLTDKAIFNELQSGYEELNKMLFTFMNSVSQFHRTSTSVKKAHGEDTRSLS